MKAKTDNLNIFNNFSVFFEYAAYDIMHDDSLFFTVRASVLIH